MFERITVDQQAQTATVYYWTGVEPCYVLDRVEVEPREDTVVVTVFEGSNAGPDTSCIQLARFVRTTFELPEPIAGRTIIDGATGQPVT